MVECPNCQHHNPPDAVSCTNCANPLPTGGLLERWETEKVPAEEQTTTQAKQARPGTDRFKPNMELVLYIVGSSDSLHLDIHAAGSVLLGRFDPHTGRMPSLNLGRFSGLGVSRRHAEIMVVEEQLSIADLGSSNGTYLNGRRLPAYQPHFVRDGDTIRLGLLKFKVSFEHAGN